MRDQQGSMVDRKKSGHNERDILIEWAIMGLARNLVPGKLPRTHKDDPQLRLLAVVERVPELIFP